MKETLTNTLNKIAKLKSKPFCYGCYKEAPTGKCVHCGSDDLMRIVPGVGCEYGFNWIFEEILSEFDAVDSEELFEESIRECYSEQVQVGWIKVDIARAIKELDPVSWRIAKSEWLDAEESDERLVTFDNGSTYFDGYRLEEQLLDLEHALAASVL